MFGNLLGCDVHGLGEVCDDLRRKSSKCPAISRQIATVLPWQHGPRHLVSWLDMKKFQAEKYINVATNLGALSAQFAQHPQTPFTQPMLQLLLAQLLERGRECRDLGLSIAARQFESAAADIGLMTPARGTFLAVQASTMITFLQNAVSSEMEEHLFLWVQSAKAGYYERAELFGEKVQIRFAGAGKEHRAGRSTLPITIRHVFFTVCASSKKDCTCLRII